MIVMGMGMDATQRESGILPMRGEYKTRKSTPAQYTNVRAIRIGTMNIIVWFRRKSAIRKYLKILGPTLKEKYGKKNSYEAREVIDTVRHLKLTEKFVFYALALYCTKEDYEKVVEYPQSMVMDYAMARTAGFNIALASGVFNGSDSGNTDSSIDGGDDFGGDT